MLPLSENVEVLDLRKEKSCILRLLRFKEEQIFYVGNFEEERKSTLVLLSYLTQTAKVTATCVITA